MRNILIFLSFLLLFISCNNANKSPENNMNSITISTNEDGSISFEQKNSYYNIEYILFKSHRYCTFLV